MVIISDIVVQGTVDPTLVRCESLSTITSSVAAEQIRESEVNVTQNNVRVETTQKLHVGDVINNIYELPSDSLAESVVGSEDSLIHAKTKKCNFIRSKEYWFGFLSAVIIIALSAVIVYYSIVLSQNEPEVTPMTLKYVTRDEWFKSDRKLLLLPIRRIIVAHSADSNETCFDKDDCIERVRKIYQNHRNLIDIPYNFLIGGDGTVFEGRGFLYEGEHTTNSNGTNFNDIGVCVAFIGTFETAQPTNEQLEALNKFINHFVNEKIIAVDHKIFFQDQLSKPITPADALLEVISNFSEFYPLQRIYRRDEWNAVSRDETDGKKFESPISRFILMHTVTNTCQSEEDCAHWMRLVQKWHIDSRLGDIAYHFVIGGDGYVFEGRGFDIIGAHTFGHNMESIGISFIGDFREVPPNNATIDAALRFFDDAAALGKITEEYQINAHMDVRESEAPGEAFMKIIRTWPRYKKYKPIT